MIKSYKNHFTVLIFICGIISANAQEEDFVLSTDSCDSSSSVSFFKSFGGAHGEQGNDVALLDNGNIATALKLVSSDGMGVVSPGLLLTDRFGEKIFCKKYPSVPHPNTARFVIPNAQGFLLGGVSWFLQTDSLGEVIWSKENGVGGNYISISSVYPLSDGCLLIGTTESGIGLLKIDTGGNIVFSRRILMVNPQFHGISVKPYEGGYMMAGRGSQNGSKNAFIMRLDAEANVVWNRYFNTIYEDHIVGFLKDEEDNFYLIGRSPAINSQWDIFVIKIDDNGTVIQIKHYDGNNGDESAQCATLMGDSTIAVSFDHGGSGDRSPAVMSLNTADLTVNWCKTYEYETMYTNYVLDIATSENDGLVMVGNMHVVGKVRDTYLIKTDANGDAGCFTNNYNIGEIDKEFEEFSVAHLSDSIQILFSKTEVFAVEAEDVVEFNLCENIPPCSGFEGELTSAAECEQACYLFSDASSFFPSAWEWSFENGNPSSYSGQNPPEICWNESGQYELLLTVSSGEASHTSSHTLEIDLDCPPVIPNVISPNADGINDDFNILYLPSSFQLMIYNRWGQPVFETSDPQNKWSGRHDFMDEELSEGVYFYHFFDISQQKTYKGHVQLLR